MATKQTKQQQRTISTTLGHLVSAQETLARLASMDLPIKAAYCIKRIREKSEADLTHWNKQRNAWIKELGTEREPTPSERAAGQVDPVSEIDLESEHFAEFDRRMKELGETPVTLSWGPLDLALFGDVRLRGRDLAALGPLVRPLDDLEQLYADPATDAKKPADEPAAAGDDAEAD